MASSSDIVVSTELELLEKVFMRIAFAESDDQLESTLKGFIVPVLLKLTSENQEVKNKIIELLTHVNKRLKSRPKIKLPLEALLGIYQDENVASSISNFTIIYIKMGYQRADKDQQVCLIPRIFACLKNKAKQHQYTLLQNILNHLNDYKYPESIEKRKELFSFSNDKQLLQLALSYLSDFLLLPYNVSSIDVNDASAVVKVASLSKTALVQVKGDQQRSAAEVESIKLGIIKFLSCEIFASEDIISMFIIATSDVKSSVADNADHAIKKFSSVALWEQANVMNKLLSLYQGTPTKQNVPDNIRNPSSVRLKMKIFPYLLKSKYVVDCNPGICLQIIFGGLFGPEESTHSKIKTYCLEFIHHITYYGSNDTLKFLGPLFYQALTRFALNDKEERKQRCIAFTGFSKLAKRAPHIFKRDIALVQKLFTLVEEEGGEVRASIQECLSSISHSFSGLDGMNVKMMETLVLSNIEKDIDQSRLAAVQFANNAFPSTHILSRYACLLCVGDSKDDVKDEALRGLVLTKSKKENVNATNFYPKYADMCTYIYEKMLERKDKYKENSIVFSTPVYEKILKYLLECLYSSCEITEQDQLDSSYIKKLSLYFQHHMMDIDKTDIWKTVIGQHIILLKESLVPSTDYSIHTIALKHLLIIICAQVDRLSSLFYDQLQWFQKFVFSTKDEIREHASRLFAVILTSQSDHIIFKYLNDFMLKLDSKETEESHGSILCCGYIISCYATKSTTVEDMEIDEQFDMKTSLNKFLTIIGGKLKESNTLILQACCVAIGEIGKVYELPKKSQDEKKQLEVIIDSLCKFVDEAPEMKVKEKAAYTLGYICIGDASIEYREKIIETLIKSSKTRQLEIHFSIGETFSCIGAGHLSDIANDKWLIKTSDNKPGNEDQNSVDLMSPLIKRIIKESIHNPVAHVRQAGITWLLCIVKYSSKHPAVDELINEIQTAFINLLSDSDEITQDIASRGLGLVYHQVKAEVKEQLVSALVERLMTGKRTKQTFEEDTEVFKPGMLGTAPDGGNLSTYKELCSLATSMNRPDLMYKFMNLANHNAIWNSKKGAAFGFLSIASITGDELKTYLPQIIPKLYRYQYDTNPVVHQAMSNIWSALVPDGKKTVDKYTKEILKELLSNITSNLWRVRESCCSALNDLIRSSSADDVIDELPNIWRITFKVIDDIKESVRKAATTLVQTLSRISIRLCDVNESKLGERAIQEILPVLLDDGLSSQVAEVKAISLQTLVKVTKNAGALIKPHMQKFIRSLLESLSGLEPQYLNTLSLQLSQSQETQDKLDTIRISASKSSPMMEAVNFCVQYVDEGVLSELVPMLSELLKTGLGLGTKVGCCTLIISLTLQCKTMLTPSAGKLLGALLNGMTDRNNALKKAYANSIGHLIRYAKESSIEKLINKITKWYFEKEDESMHYSCALCLNSMMKYSPDTSYHYNNMILPLVFIAKQQEDTLAPSERVANDDVLMKLWQEIWDNMTTGESSAIKLYLSEIISMVTPLLTSQAWGLRIKAAKSILTIATKLGDSLQQPHINNLLDVLLTALQGRTWTGKECLLQAIRELTIKCRSAFEKDPNQPLDKLVDTLLKECNKSNMVYKLNAIECVTAIIEEWKLNRFEELKPVLHKLLTADSNDDDDDEDRNALTKKQNEKLSAGYEALGRVWPFDHVTQELHFEYVKDLYIQNMLSSTWKVQQVLLKSFISFVDRTHWKEALTQWKTKESVQTFLSTILPDLYGIVETSNYASVKLNVVKIIKTFYSQAKDCNELLNQLKTFDERLQHLTTELALSTNFDISTNLTELATIKSSLENVQMEH